MFKHIIQSKEELKELIGEPGILAKNKVVAEIDSLVEQFITASPFVTIATSGTDGKCDSSPRGDFAGFVKVWDSKTLLIPERPGNRRTDSITNLLVNPQIGLLFFIPGVEETLRINGKAAIYSDPILQEKLWPEEKPPLFFLSIEVEECYIHCAKALKRSKLWKSEYWPAKQHLPSPAKIIAKHAALASYNEEKVRLALDESYKKRLY
jgi:uncharacterized protein